MSWEPQLSRDFRWPAVGVLAVFLVAGSFTRHPRDLLLSAVGTFVALAAASMMSRYGPRAALALSLLAGAGIALTAGRTGASLAWFGLCLVAFCLVIAAGWRLGAAFWLAAAVLLGSHMLTAHPDLGWLPWIAGVTVSSAGAGLIVRERTLVDELRAAQAGLAERSRAEERNRIARDLHDVIAHSLTVSLLHVTSARLAVEHDPGDAARSLAEAERLGRESLDEVRSIVGLLRSDDERGRTAPVPGMEAIPDLVERFRAAGAAVTLESDGELGRLPATVGTTLYRIAQEALTNAAKHAPGGTVVVRLAAAADGLALTIDSAGAPGHGAGTGLTSMRERAEAVGGRCESGPADGGWRVRASVPVPVGRSR
ncbi:MAG: sensor histidine kinase [Solirubrobacteraceae bacterium]